MAGVNANQVYASGFPDSTNESDLYLFFGSYGEVTTVKLLINKKKGALIGAFITFRDCRCSEMVLEDQKRRQMFFKGAKIHVREAYVDKQSSRSGGGGMTGPARDTDYRQGFRPDRIEREDSIGGNYNKNYSDNRSTSSYQSPSSNQNPFLQSSIFTSSTRSAESIGDNRSGGQYGGYSGGSSTNNIVSSSGGYGADRREDSYSQNNGNRSQGYNDSYRSQSNYNRQDNVSMNVNTSQRFDDMNRSTGYRDDYNQSSSRAEGSFSGGNTSYAPGGGSGSWADIMDNEDRFGDRNRSSYDNRSRDVSMNDSSIRDSSMGMNRDSYGQGNRSGTVGGYDRYGAGGQVQSDRQMQSDRSMQSGHYADGGRHQTSGTDRGYTDGGAVQQGNYGREQDRYDDRDNRKRGSEWVGGYDASPRKQVAMTGRDDRPTGFTQQRESENQQFHSMDNMPRNVTSYRDEPATRGPTATSTPRDSRGFEPSGRSMGGRGDQDYRRDNLNRGREERDERGRKSGFVGGPDRKYRTTEREARGGARRESPRRMAGNGPNFRQQTIDQGRQQHADGRRGNMDGGMRDQDRRGWVGGGSLDQQQNNNMMGGNISPHRGGMNSRGDGQGFQGGVNQEQMRLLQQEQQQRQQVEMEMQRRQQQQQQQMEMQMEMQRRQQQRQQQQREMQMRQQQLQQQQQQQQQQQRASMMGGQGGNMQGIMSTLAQLLQNLTKGRDNQQRQLQPNLLRELNALERDVVAEVKRSLQVDETPLFASAIVMMRPMDDGVIKIFTQLPQGILMKILRGASPDEVAKALSEVPRTKTYDNRDEARFHVLRKLLIVLYKVSRESNLRNTGMSGTNVTPLDFSRQRLMLARKRLATRGARTGFRRIGDANKVGDRKDGEKKEDRKEGTNLRSIGRGGFRSGFRDGFRGRGGFRGARRGVGSFRGQGRGRVVAKSNGAAKKPETKTPAATNKKTEATKKTTDATPKKTTTVNTIKKPASTPAVKKPAVVKKTPTQAAKKTPVKTPTKTTPSKTPTKKST